VVSPLERSDAEHIDQAAIAQAQERVADGIRGLTKVCRNLLVRERPVLLQQREDRPLHATVPIPAGGSSNPALSIDEAPELTPNSL
jgi:hypothetical protein